MNRWYWLLACLTLTAGCAHIQPLANTCSESRDLRCMAVPVCSMDRVRGCMVCVCHGDPSDPATKPPLPERSEPLPPRPQ